MCLCTGIPSLCLFHQTGRESPDLRAFQREVQSKGSIVQKLCAQDKRRRKGKISESEGTIKEKRRPEIKAERVKSKGQSRNLKR